MVYRIQKKLWVSLIYSLSYCTTLYSIDPGTFLIGLAGYITLRPIESAIKTCINAFNDNKPPAITYNTLINHNGSGILTVTLPSIPIVRSDASKNLFAFMRNTSAKTYAKTAGILTISGYLYILSRVSWMQAYLAAPTCISYWFADTTFEKLLLLDTDQMHELITQEFMQNFQVHDQKSLKDGIYAFLQNIEEELACWHHYEKFVKRIDTGLYVSEKSLAFASATIKALIPLSSLVIDSIPSINMAKLLGINHQLFAQVQERIARLHYYKNIFLQSTIVI